MSKASLRYATPGLSESGVAGRPIFKMPPLVADTVAAVGLVAAGAAVGCSADVAAGGSAADAAALGCPAGTAVGCCASGGLPPHAAKIPTSSSTSIPALSDRRIG